MTRKKYIIAAFLLLLLGVGAFVANKYLLNSAGSVDAYHAIPGRSTAFISTNNISTLKQKIDSASYQSILVESSILSQIVEQSFHLDSILDQKNINEKLSYNKILFSLSNTGSSNMGLITVLEMNLKVKLIMVKNMLSLKKADYTEYKYQNNKIISVKNYKNESDLSFAVYENLIVFSPHATLVEETLNTLYKEESETLSSQFQDLLLFSDSKSDGLLFINHKSNDLNSLLINSDRLDFVKNKKPLANWSSYQLFFEKDNIKFKGKYSGQNKSSLDNIKNSKSGAFTLDKFLPNNTAFYEATCSENNISFESNDVSYSFFKDWLDQEAAYFCLETYDENYLKRSGLVLKTINLDTAKISLYLLNKEMTPVDNYEDVAIYEMNADVLSQTFKSEFFKFDNPFFIFIDDYVVFANDKNVLRTCLKQYHQNKTLINEPSYHLDQTNLSNKIVYMNPQRWSNTLNSIFKLEIFPLNIGKTVIQFYNSDTLMYSEGNVFFEKEEIIRSSNIWDVALDTVSTFKPQIVINENNQRKEIITQDVANTIYLINQAGDIVFKKEFESKILSDIYQIDLYKANKLLYVFNTKTHIYALKRNGSVANGYPIKLPADATNPIHVVNYDKARIYRYFIACTNNKVYGYEANGKPLKGWSPLGNFGNVNSKIKHRTIEGKDYIYFCTSNGTFHAFNRKGIKRFKAADLDTDFKQAFEPTLTGFVNFSEGSAYKINLKGEPIAKILTDSTYNVFSNYAKEDAYAIANNKEFRVAKSKWTILGKKTLNDEIEHIKTIVIQEKTWFLVKAKMSIYLINELGEIHPDFPMLSDSKARISKFYSNKNEIMVFSEGDRLRAFELVMPD